LYLSGAGGNDKEENINDNKVYGFLKSKLFKGEIYATYYYTTDSKNWKTWDAPVQNV